MFNKTNVMTHDIHRAYTIHEKKFGDWAAIKSVTSSKRKLQYEEVPIQTFQLILNIFFDFFNLQEIKDNPTNYDVWFDYLKLIKN